MVKPNSSWDLDGHRSLIGCAFLAILSPGEKATFDLSSLDAEVLQRLIRAFKLQPDMDVYASGGTVTVQRRLTRTAPKPRRRSA